MRKKYIFYIMILLIAIIFQKMNTIKSTISNYFNNPNKIQEISIFSDDYLLSTKFNKENKVNGTKIVYRKNNPDVIITMNNVTDNNYVKSDIYFYTPIILGNFEGNTYYNMVSINNSPILDYGNLLNGFLEDKTYNEIGMDVNEKIKICIPSESSPYYEAVLNQMYYSMYKETLTEENLKTFYSLVDKCEKVDNLYLHMKQRDEDYTFYFVPEFFYHEKSMYIAYDEAHTSLKYNIYIRKNSDKDVMSVLSSKKFYEKYGLRNNNPNFSFSYLKEKNDILEIDNFLDLEPESGILIDEEQFVQTVNHNTVEITKENVDNETTQIDKENVNNETTQIDENKDTETQNGMSPLMFCASIIILVLFLVAFAFFLEEW